jgi:hypothetical protein
MASQTSAAAQPARIIRTLDVVGLLVFLCVACATVYLTTFYSPASRFYMKLHNYGALREHNCKYTEVAYVVFQDDAPVGEKPSVTGPFSMTATRESTSPPAWHHPRAALCLNELYKAPCYFGEAPAWKCIADLDDRVVFNHTRVVCPKCEYRWVSSDACTPCELEYSIKWKDGAEDDAEGDVDVYSGGRGEPALVVVDVDD